MCCRISIHPIDVEIAVAVLSVGQFKPTYWLPGRDVASNWERAVAEEDCKVIASINDGTLELNISPSISTASHHIGKRITAGIYFEIAAKYAEKVNGEIIQRATVAGCTVNGRAQELLLAQYPNVPMQWENICAGFKAVILGPNLDA